MKTIPRRRQIGFTIIELMITLAVLAVLVTIAAPGMRDLIVNNQADSLGEELVAAVQATKTEAVKRGRRVSLCASNADGTACAADWSEGWLLFADDAASDEAATPVVNGANIVRHINELNGNANISATNNGSAVNFIRFSSTGQLARVGGSANTNPVVFDTYIAHCKGDRRLSVAVGVAGMMNVAKTDCATGL